MLMRFIVFCLFSCLFCACSNDKELTINGAKLVLKEDVEGENAHPGDSIIYHLKLVNRTQERIINNTYKRGTPQANLVKKKPTFTGGVEEVYPYLSEGDSAIVYVEAKNLFPENIPWKLAEYDKQDQLEYYLKVISIKRKEK